MREAGRLAAGEVRKVWCRLIIVVALVTVFVATVMTGPAGKDWLAERRDRRRLELDRPLAKVIYLPSESCRATYDEYGRIEYVDPTTI
jgi:hypothetical protein